MFDECSKVFNDIDVFIITVPTPLKDNNEPDLSFIMEASIMVGKAIKLNSNSNNNQINSDGSYDKKNNKLERMNNLDKFIKEEGNPRSCHFGRSLGSNLRVKHLFSLAT